MRRPQAKSVETSYYKEVKKDTRLIEDLNNGVGVHMQWTENTESELIGFYDIYIAGTVENSLNPSDWDYYVAKFSTKYNYTEWYR